MTAFNQWRKEVEDRLGKATQGPWWSGAAIWFRVYDADGNYIASTRTALFGKQRANAELIGNAPSDLARALTEIDKRDGEIKELTRKGEELCNALGIALIEKHDDKKRIGSLEAAIAKMREALEFYGEMNNWNGMDHVSPGPMFTDMCGVRARQALHDAEVKS